jgi:hypothetical protein
MISTELEVLALDAFLFMLFISAKQRRQTKWGQEALASGFHHLSFMKDGISPCL